MLSGCQVQTHCVVCQYFVRARLKAIMTHGTEDRAWGNREQDNEPNLHKAMSLLHGRLCRVYLEVTSYLV